MPRTRKKFARLDLSASIAREVEVVARFQLTEERLAILKQFREDQFSSSFPDSLPIVGSYAYKVNNTPHHLLIMVYQRSQWGGPDAGDEDDIQIRLHYNPGEAVKAGRRGTYPPERTLVALLSRLGAPKDQSGSVDLRVTGVDPDDLWFPLPTKLASERDPEALFEVVAIRGVKLAPDNQSTTLYRFSVSHNGDGIANVILWLDLDSAGPDMARTALNRATKLLPDLVAQ